MVSKSRSHSPKDSQSPAAEQGRLLGAVVPLLLLRWVWPKALPPFRELESAPALSRAYDCQESSPMGWFSSQRS